MQNLMRGITRVGHRGQDHIAFVLVRSLMADVLSFSEEAVRQRPFSSTPRGLSNGCLNMFFGLEGAQDFRVIAIIGIR